MTSDQIVEWLFQNGSNSRKKSHFSRFPKKRPNSRNDLTRLNRRWQIGDRQKRKLLTKIPIFVCFCFFVFVCYKEWPHNGFHIFVSESIVPEIISTATCSHWRWKNFDVMTQPPSRFTEKSRASCLLATCLSVGLSRPIFNARFYKLIFTCLRYHTICRSDSIFFNEFT